MRLSEAIKLGATLKPQAFTQHDIEASCALAAACEAYAIDRIPMGGNTTPIIDYVELASRCGDLSMRDEPCPVCRKGFKRSVHPFFSVIWHLNDNHRWSREQIADWVSQYESAEVERKPEPVQG